MNKISALKVNCCNEDKRCEVCPPEWSRKYFVEIDQDKAGLERYQIFFPLSGFDDAMYKNVKYFKPHVLKDGVWYLKEEYVMKIYKKTELMEKLKQTCYVLKQKCADDEAQAAKELSEGN